MSAVVRFEQVGDDRRELVDKFFKRVRLGVQAKEIALLDIPDAGFGIVRNFNVDAPGLRIGPRVKPDFILYGQP